MHPETNISLSGDSNDSFSTNHLPICLLPEELHRLIFSFVPSDQLSAYRLISEYYNSLILPRITKYSASTDLQLSRLMSSSMFPFIQELHIERLMLEQQQLLPSSKTHILTAHMIVEVVLKLLKRRENWEQINGNESDSEEPFNGTSTSKQQRDDQHSTSTFSNNSPPTLRSLHLKYFNLNYAGKMTRNQHETMFLTSLFTVCGPLIAKQVEDLTLLTLDTNDAMIARHIPKYTPRLKKLNLWGNEKITNTTVIHLVNSSLKHQLTHLKFGAFGITLTDCSLISIADCMPQILHLNLRRCSGLTQKSICHLAERAPHLKYLDLGFNHRVNDTALLAITNNLLELQCLRLRRCCITQEGIQNLGQLQQLKTLELSETSIVSLDPLKPLAPHLEELYINRCEKLIDLEALSHLTKLRHLSIAHFYRLEPAIMHSICDKLKHLEYLEICCGKLTDASLIRVTTLQKLHTLHLHYATKMSDQSFIEICKHLTGLKSFLCTKCETLSVEAATHLSLMKSLQNCDLSLCGELRKRMFDERLKFFLKIPNLRL